jgi:hypothetical protein
MGKEHPGNWLVFSQVHGKFAWAAPTSLFIAFLRLDLQLF